MFSTSFLKPLNKIQQNLTGSKILTSSTKFVFFGLIGTTKWPPRPLSGWDIFDFSSGNAEQISTKLNRKQHLNILYQVCVFQVDGKSKMAALASDWLRNFSTLFWTHWTKFNKTWQEVKILTSSTKFVLFRPIGKARWLPGPLIGWDILDFSSEMAEQNSTKLDRKKDLYDFYQVVFFGLISKRKWLPWPIRQKGGKIVLRCIICGLWAFCFFYSWQYINE